MCEKLTNSTFFLVDSLIYVKLLGEKYRGLDCSLYMCHFFTVSIFLC